jgi:hypothetical protein
VRMRDAEAVREKLKKFIAEGPEQTQVRGFASPVGCLVKPKSACIPRTCTRAEPRLETSTKAGS